MVRYFPSSENGKIVAWEDNLKTGIDYDVKCDTFDKSKGKATFTITAKGDYTGEYKGSVRIKLNNPMKLKAKTAVVNYSKLKKKTQTIKRNKVIVVSQAKGKPAFEYVSAKKGKKSFTKYFKVNARTGNVTVKKGLGKGTYKVKVKVMAAGNTKYSASPWKTVTCRIKVR